MISVFLALTLVPLCIGANAVFGVEATVLSADAAGSVLVSVDVIDEYAAAQSGQARNVVGSVRHGGSLVPILLRRLVPGEVRSAAKGLAPGGLPVVAVDVTGRADFSVGVVDVPPSRDGMGGASRVVVTF